MDRPTETNIEVDQCSLKLSNESKKMKVMRETPPPSYPEKEVTFEVALKKLKICPKNTRKDGCGYEKTYLDKISKSVLSWIPTRATNKQTLLSDWLYIGMDAPHILSPGRNVKKRKNDDLIESQVPKKHKKKSQNPRFGPQKTPPPLIKESTKTRLIVRIPLSDL